MHLHTVSVTRLSQLEPGVFYQIVGSDTARLPSPPQVFQFKQLKHTPVLGPMLHGTLYVQIGTQKLIYKNHIIPAWQVNLPENGMSDGHLRRIPKALMETLKDHSYTDIQQQKPRSRTYHPHGLPVPR